ncbi:MAG: hypothetical protein KDC35_11860, partial [Acidobacteria bacterium]|nr:hypothetical protein [Acidobacteriota bacterium]
QQVDQDSAVPQDQQTIQVQWQATLKIRGYLPVPLANQMQFWLRLSDHRCLRTQQFRETIQVHQVMPLTRKSIRRVGNQRR